MGLSRIQPFHKPIVIGLFTVVVVISAVVISFNYYTISKREKILLENKADEYIDALTSALEVPVWDIDRENIKNICTYYFNNELITMVLLTGMSGETLYNKKKKLEHGNEHFSTRSKKSTITGNSSAISKLL